MLELDHIAVLGETLDEAAAHVEAALDTPMSPGGRHARFGTHNRLMGLRPGLYIEAIAIDPAAAPPKDARWFGLDGFKGPARLDKWICRVPDLDAAITALPMAGRPVALSRDGLRWRVAVPEGGQMPFDGVFPALIEWQTDVPPGRALPPAAGVSLRGLVVRHPRAEALAALLTPYLDAPLVRFETGDIALQGRFEVAGAERDLF